MLDLQKENNEVYYLKHSQKILCIQDFNELMSSATNSRRNRARFCTHDNKESDIHEMFEVLTREVYMRPHKQKDKLTSYHLVFGMLYIYLFDDEGQMIDRIFLSDYHSGASFYCRVPQDIYRMLVPQSDFALYHEIRKGPFSKTDTIFAPWAPDEEDHHNIEKFIARLPVD